MKIVSNKILKTLIIFIISVCFILLFYNRKYLNYIYDNFFYDYYYIEKYSSIDNLFIFKTKSGKIMKAKLGGIIIESNKENIEELVNKLKNFKSIIKPFQQYVIPINKKVDTKLKVIIFVDVPDYLKKKEYIIGIIDPYKGIGYNFNKIIVGEGLGKKSVTINSTFQ